MVLFFFLDFFFTSWFFLKGEQFHKHIVQLTEEVPNSIITQQTGSFHYQKKTTALNYIQNNFIFEIQHTYTNARIYC